jgi:glycerol-3-phosphate dehydrogenase
MTISDPSELTETLPNWDVLTQTRQQMLHSLRRRPVFDLLIVGGGIAGAALARLAAFNGVRTILIERGDYASATSGRSSKMAHGGLRYLEMLDFAQVREGVLSRDDLFNCAPHLVKPHAFLIPVKRGNWLSRFKFQVGLTIYDLLAGTKKDRRHHWLSRSDLGDTPLASIAEKLAGAFEFTDGIMDDSRLVLENIIAARQEGAVCLNYAEFVTYEIARDRSVQVTWRDLISGNEHKLTTGVIANCAGPWVTRLGRITPSSEMGEVAYSRGIHLLFNRKWDGPAILLPMPERGRNYFIWPHPAGTLVGTTDSPTKNAEWDPIPEPQEVQEILDRLSRDLPAAELDRSSLHYAFAGIRTLPMKVKRKVSGGKVKTSQLSRRHRWVETPGMLSLVGGKLTSASWAAQEGLERIFKLSDIVSPLAPISGRMFPGGGGMREAVANFIAEASAAGVPKQLQERALQRFGSRVRQFGTFPRAYEVVAGLVLRGEIELAVRCEQVENLEDLMGRRLGLEYMPGSGLSGLDEIARIVGEINPELPVEPQKIRYRERIERVQRVITTRP